MRPKVTARRILIMLSDGKPRSSREIRAEIGFSPDSIESSSTRLWKKEQILRTIKLLMNADKIFKGRAGKTSNLRQYHLYMTQSGAKLME